MAKGKTNLPETPQWYQDPRLDQGINSLFGLGNSLTNFDFSGSLSPLQDLISFSPESSRLALESYSSQMKPYIRDQQQSMINEMANNNQLQSSVLPDSLSRFNSDIMSQYQSIASQAALQDRQNALQNRYNLFGMGTGLLNQGTQYAQGLTSDRNAFNQQEWENQIAKIQGEKSNQGGWAGAATGALGGAMTGFTMGGPWGALAGGLAGGAGGYFGPSGTGGQIMNAGAGLYGGRTAAPGATSGYTRDILNQYKKNPNGFSFSYLGD